MIETFVETPRYTGAVYRASGWIRVGTTRGRGRYDKPKKDIWLRPLRKDWRASSPARNQRNVPGRPNAYNREGLVRNRNYAVCPVVQWTE